MRMETCTTDIVNRKKLELTCSQSILDANASIQIVFDGHITLWKSSSYLKVLIVHHVPFDCIEICVCNCFYQTEAPRVYMSASGLFERMPESAFHRLVEEKIKLCCRRQESYNLSAIERDVRYTFATKFITSRIQIDRVHSVVFQAYLQPELGDDVAEVSDAELILPGQLLNGSHLDMLIHKPRDVLSISSNLVAIPDFVHLLDQARIAFVDHQGCSLSGSPHAGAGEGEMNHEVAGRVMEVAVVAFSSTNRKRYGSSYFTSTATATVAKIRWQLAIAKILHQIACLKMRDRLEGKIKCRRPSGSSYHQHHHHHHHHHHGFVQDLRVMVHDLSQRIPLTTTSTPHTSSPSSCNNTSPTSASLVSHQLHLLPSLGLTTVLSPAHHHHHHSSPAVASLPPIPLLHPTPSSSFHLLTITTAASSSNAAKQSLDEDAYDDYWKEDREDDDDCAEETKEQRSEGKNIRKLTSLSNAIEETAAVVIKLLSSSTNHP